MLRNRAILATLLFLLAAVCPLAAQVGPLRFLYIPGGTLTPKAGDRVQVTAQEFYFSNSTQTTAVIDVTNQVQWSVATTFSSCPPGPAGPPPAADVQATVSSSGLVTVTGSGSGNLAVLAKSGPILACKQLTITGIQSIAVTPAAPTIPVGEVQQMTATVTFNDNSTADFTTAVTWSSVDSSNVPISSSGVISLAQTATKPAAACVTGVPQAGCSDITAAYGAATSPADTVTVGFAVIESLTISPANFNIVPAAGTQKQFTATGHYSDGSTSDLSNCFLCGTSWSSSNTNVFTVSSCEVVIFPCSNPPGPGGTVTGVAPGYATLKATNTNIFTNQTVSASVQVITGMNTLTISPAPTATMTKGGFQVYTATGGFSSAPIPNSNVTNSVNFFTSDPTVASIGTRIRFIRCGFSFCIIIQFGAFGVGQGTATISARTSNASKFGCTFSGLVCSAGTTQTVTAPTLVAISLSPGDSSLAQGQSLPFTATGFYTDGSTQNLTNNIALTFNSNSTAADFPCCNKGLAKAESAAAAPNPATISATCAPFLFFNCPGNSGTLSSNSIALTVNSAVLSSIIVAPANQAIANASAQPPGSKQYTATGVWSDGFTFSPLPYGGDATHAAAPLTWSSVNTAVASISNCASNCGANPRGKANSVLLSGSGLTQIVAASGSVSASTDLTVGAVVQSITVTPQAATMPVGNGPAPSKQQITAIGNFSNGTSKDITASVTWATCAGNLISNSAGTAGQLTASTANNACATTATDPSTSVVGMTNVAIKTLVTPFTVTPLSQTLSVGQTQQYTAMANYTGGPTNQNIGPFLTWSSSDNTVATLSPGGVAAAVNAGGPINVMAAVGTANNSTNTTLTVNAASLVSLTVVGVSPTAGANPSIQTNATEVFMATANFSDGSTLDVSADPGTVWMSSNTSIASFNDSNNPNAATAGKGPGSTTITATYTPMSGPAVMGSTTLTTHF